MKQFNNIIILFLSFLSLASCENSHKKQENTNETPEVFQEQTVLDNVSTYSKRGKYETLVDKLYNELIEKDAELKNIEDEFKVLTKNNSNIEINNFLSNNTKYYEELKPFLSIEDSIANMKSYVAMIQDSTLREKMLEEVYKSEDSYKTKIVALENIQETLRNKITEMRDYRTALKISLTLNSIEKYQDNFNQDTASIKTLIKRCVDLTNTIKNKIDK